MFVSPFGTGGRTRFVAEIAAGELHTVMFQLLAERAMLQEESASGTGTAAAGELLAPPKTWVAPLGASARTWHNILQNKNNIDYCTSQFHYLKTRCAARCRSIRLHARGAIAFAAVRALALHCPLPLPLPSSLPAFPAAASSRRSLRFLLPPPHAGTVSLCAPVEVTCLCV